MSLSGRQERPFAGRTQRKRKNSLSLRVIIEWAATLIRLIIYSYTTLDQRHNINFLKIKINFKKKQNKFISVTCYQWWMSILFISGNNTLCVSILMAPFSRLFYFVKNRARESNKHVNINQGIISRGNRVELLLYTATLPNLARRYHQKLAYKTFTIKDKTM